MKKQGNIEFENSSGNVFDDLGIDNAEELQARGMVGFHVVELLKRKDMKQREIAELLGIKQTEVSHLLNGHFSRFDATCRCHRRVDTAIALGRVNPTQLHFASSPQQAKRFPQVLAQIRQLEETRRAAALYQSHPDAATSDSFIAWLKKLLDEIADTTLTY